MHKPIPTLFDIANDIEIPEKHYYDFGRDELEAALAFTYKYKGSRKTVLLSSIHEALCFMKETFFIIDFEKMGENDYFLHKRCNNRYVNRYGDMISKNELCYIRWEEFIADFQFEREDVRSMMIAYEWANQITAIKNKTT